MIEEQAFLKNVKIIQIDRNDLLTSANVIILSVGKIAPATKCRHVVCLKQ